jgi:oxazoline/thiazoline dehydrogenase
MIVPSTQDYILSFIKGVTIETRSEDRTVVQMPITYQTLILKSLSIGLREAINILALTGAKEEELADIVLKTDGLDGLARFYYHMMTFTWHRIISYGIACHGERLAALAPASAFFSFSPVPVNPQANYVLSRFAYLRREGEEMVMESPLAHGTVTLHGKDAAAIAAELARPQTLASLYDRLHDVPRDAIALFLQMLVGTGFAFKVKMGETNSEGTEALTQWEFHDLLFHARSRKGRHATPNGATYRFHGKIDPLPAIKPTAAETVIPLNRPDMDVLREDDFPFTLIVEERRSIREYADKPITDRQLGEFLYRTARVKDMIKSDVQDISRRPYPGGGAIYELEIYVTVNVCENIPPGLYHYCPVYHRLEMVSGRTETTDSLLKDALNSTGQEGAPQVLLTLAARFQRLTWKYQSMAYNLLLKNVGVLYQTMYLVATAMDLAPCALGGGDSDLFAKAAGLDYYTETSVGEFLLGSKRI